jgi:histidinol-phosphate aminotransferase
MGNGSDEAIVAAGRIILEKGAEMVASMPSFPSYYKSALVNGATVKTSGIRDNGGSDVDEMLSLITDKTKLVFAATPNNPTGGILNEKEVKKLVEMVPDTALLILDEAYYEFAAGKKGFDSLSVMKKRRGPWAIFRTFSKAYGLASLPVGYILCGSKEVYAAFQMARSTFNVNALGQVAAFAALQDEKHMKNIVSKTIKERQRLFEGLLDLRCRPYPSEANFVSAFTPLIATQIVESLAKKQILISRIDAVGFEKCIRVTVGHQDDTDDFLSEMSELLKWA